MPKRLTFLRNNITAGRPITNFDAINRRRAFDFYRENELGPASAEPCYICLKDAEQWHHIVPVHRGGRDSYLNLVPLCHICHKRVHRQSVVRSNRKEKPFINPRVTPVITMVYVPPKQDEKYF